MNHLEYPKTEPNQAEIIEESTPERKKEVHRIGWVSTFMASPVLKRDENWMEICTLTVEERLAVREVTES